MIRTKAAAGAGTAALALSLVVGLAGCTTPAAQSSIELPGRFAMPAESSIEPEVAWWESYRDPVLTDLFAAPRERTGT